MSCQCVGKIRTATIGARVQRGEITGADFRHIALYMPQGSNVMTTRTFSEMSITIKGRKTPVNQTVVHKYCPFCGEEYDKMENTPSV